MQRKTKILIFDDEPEMRFYLCNLLCSCGYATVHALDQRDGLRKARREKPGLIILDVMMADEAGLRFYHDLKADAQLKCIPVIMVSSVGMNAFQQYRRSCRSVPEVGTPAPGAYLKKPLNADELIGWVRTLTGSSAHA